MSTMTASWSLLRRALLADGVISGATGTLLFLGASPLGGVLGLNEALLRTAGFSLLPFAAFLVYLAAREHTPSWLIRGVVAINVLWVLDSVLLLVTGWAEPTLWGYLFTGGQALAVAAFAGLEYVGLRRSSVALA